MFKSRSAFIFLFVGIILLLTSQILFLQNKKPLADERYHIAQIKQFYNGNYAPRPIITTPPFYHLVFVGALHVIDKTLIYHFSETDQLRICRTLTAFVSLFCLLCIGVLTGKILRVTGQANIWFSCLAVLSFTLLPFVTPFLPLLYTDIPAILFLLLSVERALSGKQMQSVTMLLCAVLIRQPAIVWGLIPLWLSIQPALGTLHIRDKILHLVKNSYGFILVYLGFFIFVLINHGVALGDRNAQTIAFNPTNIWLLLILWAVFFFPDFLKGIRSAWQYIMGLYKEKKDPYLLALISLAVFIFMVYVYCTFYAHPHKYNSFGYWFYIRNSALVVIGQSFILKSIASVVTTLSAIALAFTSFNIFKRPVDRAMFLLTTTLAISTLPVIEQRYFFPFFAFYVCFKQWQNDSRFSLVWIFVMGTLSLITTYYVYIGRFFI